MELDVAKKLLADWVEKEVILKVYTGAERYLMLFALPFKIQELVYKVEDNRDVLEAWGMLDRGGINLDRLEAHAVDTMDKCGRISMEVGSKTLTFCSDDIRNAIAYLRSACQEGRRVSPDA